jgi:hypothetical protein
VSGLGAVLTGAQLATFEERAGRLGLPYRRDGERLAFTLRR